ncbi:PTH2 and/or DUF2000 domain containing protein [Asbolus verrucosus]|uniref:peptidyl-tRNA hydrolase n=1 Tax=Asbolus verrucosus TaxID=1661398 RepID=A0A482VSJ7_ASBVE|nr:PTH2 and/or DUF2000 domain containing protein [Asbolus verrucosus]
MVIIIRTDLNMGKGKIASQAAHAAVSLYESALKSSNPHLKSWLLSGQPKVILKVDSYNVLISVYDGAKLNNLNACVIRDAGLTQIEAGALTAVGIGPGKEEDIDKLTKTLKLL